MKKFYYIITLLIVFICSIKISHADHVFSGDITYECLGGNKFKFYLRLYSLCSNGVSNRVEGLEDQSVITIFENSPSPSLKAYGIFMYKLKETVPPNVSKECIDKDLNICLSVKYFEGEVTIPPSIYGYTVTNERTFRSQYLKTLENPMQRIGTTNIALIPPFKDNECINNSPKVANHPSQILCINNPYSYDHSATDLDGDSLYYRFCEAKLGFYEYTDLRPSPILGFSPPPIPSIKYNTKENYSFDNFLGLEKKPEIHPNTGLITFTPIAFGRYLMNVCIDEYRNGEYISTYSRESMLIVFDCNKNVYADMPIFTDDPNTYMINCKNYEVTFKNSSVGASSYVWDFGDGSPEVNTMEPTHVYRDTGTYKVKLAINRGTSCSDSIYKMVKVYPVFRANFNTDTFICPGVATQLIENIESTYGNDSFNLTWIIPHQMDTFKTSSPIVTFDSGGDNSVILIAESSLGCVDTAYKNVAVFPFKPNAGSDTIIVKGYDYRMNASGGTSYSWDNNPLLKNLNDPNSILNTSYTGEYNFYVNIGHEAGCSGRDSVNIVIVDEPSILMPNAFSPNGDGVNDIIYPNLTGYPNVVDYRIYNRWGKEVFIGYKNSDGWDGTYNNEPAPIGVYHYIINIRQIDNNIKQIKGDITLIR